MTLKPVSALTLLGLCLSILLSACQPRGYGEFEALPAYAQQMPIYPLMPSSTPQASPTPWFTERPRYSPGELVDYIAQDGDTLPFLAARFNTTVTEILEANPIIPANATTMPAGMPMKIPIYYLPLWGSPYQILPDSHFINGPLQVGFNTQEFVNSQPGWLKDYQGYVAKANRSGAEIVDFVAHYYSVSPRLLLALLEYQSGALTQSEVTDETIDYALGYRHWSRKGLYMQLAWAANLLNNGYYGYKTWKLTILEHPDGRIERIDPWQNAASVSLMLFFNTLLDAEGYQKAISPEGFAKTYRELFGDPWQNNEAHFPGSLTQPEFILPFQPGDVWALTSGPHAGWGTGEPLAALDFAPPSKTSGCVPSGVWATAIAGGVIVRSSNGEVMLDLDGDGDERTGWNIFYLHIATEGRVPLGAVVKQGDPIGHPSCEGGSSTGTHIHIARKYNGEWIPAAGTALGVLPFVMEGWVPFNGNAPYLGTLQRNQQIVIACTCSNAASFIKSDRLPADETK